MQPAISKINPPARTEHDTEHDTEFSSMATADQNSGISTSLDPQRDVFFIEEIDVVPAESMMAHRT